MNKSSRTGWALFALATVSFGLARLVAQDVSPPKPPFVTNLPESTKWTLTLTAPPGKKASSDPAKQQMGDAYISSVEAEKHGNVRREVMSWSNGKFTQGWTVGEYYASDLQEGDQVHVESSTLNPAEHGAKSDFPILGWISQTNYQGVQSLNGQKCYFYQDNLPLGQGMGGHLFQTLMSSSKLAAYISVDSGLPVAAEIGGVKISFKFEPGPSEALLVPDKYLQAIARMDNVLKASRRRLPDP